MTSVRLCLLCLIPGHDIRQTDFPHSNKEGQEGEYDGSKDELEFVQE